MANKKDTFDRDIDRLMQKGTKAKVRAFGIRYQGMKYKFKGYENYRGKIVSIREDNGKLLVFDSSNRYIGTLQEESTCFRNGFSHYLKLSYYSGMSALGTLAEYLLGELDNKELELEAVNELVALCADIDKELDKEKAEEDILAATFRMMNLFKRMEKVLDTAPELFKEIGQL